MPAQEVHQAIAERLRHVLENHPDGPFTMQGLADLSGLAKRSLYRIQQGANVTLDSLIKISTSLGIDRVAYFLDEEVFRQVNAELAMLKELRQRNITSVRFREASAMALASATDYSELTELLTHIAQDVQRARSKVQPATASDHDAPERS